MSELNENMNVLNSSGYTVKTKIYNPIKGYFNSLQEAIEVTGLLSEDFSCSRWTGAVYHCIKPFEGAVCIAVVDHTQAQFPCDLVARINEKIKKLNACENLEEVLNLFPSAKKVCQISIHEMNHGLLKSPKYVKVQNTSTIDAPRCIRYAEGGDLAVDHCWVNTYGEVLYAKKGAFFEDGVN